MFCSACHAVFRGEKRISQGSTFYVTNYRHHENIEELESGAAEGCYLCCIMVRRCRERLEPHTNRKHGLLTARIQKARQRELWIQLDFKVSDEWNPIAKFVLLRSGKSTLQGVNPHITLCLQIIDEPESKDLQPSPASASTSDNLTFECARSWLNECCLTHDTCSQGKSTFYPSRLLNVGSKSDCVSTIQLVSNRPEEQQNIQFPFKGNYMTLSHRWGTVKFPKLKKSELSRFLNGLPLDSLPLTFQHAIQITRELNVQWLWIDALCIIQDDDDDWLREADLMKQVYACSYCNISATASIDSSVGIFRRHGPPTPWVATIQLKSGLFADEVAEPLFAIFDLSFWEESIESAPINRRSWVLQERLLSPRVLHWCEDQIAFECRNMDRAQRRPQDVNSLRMIDGIITDQGRFKDVTESAGRKLAILALGRREGSGAHKAFKDSIAEAKAPWPIYEIWKRIVDHYSTMELTKAEDRLIALSGIALFFAENLKLGGVSDQYVAGLWKYGLVSQLLWRVNEASGPQPQPLDDLRPKNASGEYIYRAPTFSWASVESSRGVTFAVSTDADLCASVKTVHLAYKTKENEFGILTDGYIELESTLRRILLVDDFAKVGGHEYRRAPLQSWSPNKVAAWVCARVDVSNTVATLQMLVIWGITLALLINCALPGLNQAVLCALSAVSGLLMVRPTLRAFRQSPVPPGSCENDTSVENRWKWQLVRSGQPYGPTYSVVYLDSPATLPSIFGINAQLFVMPIMLSRQALICLILQATSVDSGVCFRRIGMTRVSRLYEGEVQSILNSSGAKTSNGSEYNWSTTNTEHGKSTIRII